MELLDNLLLGFQVALSLQLSFAVVPLITFTSDRRRMGAFVYEQFLRAPNERWRWLAHVSIMAKHRLHDDQLALRYAAEITRLSPWAPPLPLVLLCSCWVVVIGGIGSVRGALAASILIGIADTFGKVLLPQAAGVLVYVLMALILIWRPHGLFKS
mgnify:CR=1 FL=1